MADYTHAGLLIGDSRALHKYVSVRLRETRHHWVTVGGTKYRKSDGSQVDGGAWARYHLDLSSVTPVADPEPRDAT